MSSSEIPNKDSSKPGGSEEDKELADLLDSALQDFSKAPQPDNAQVKETTEAKDEGDVGGEDELIDLDWADEFIKAAAQRFETTMGGSEGSDGPPITKEMMHQTFQKMAEAAAQVIANPSEVPVDGDLQATISQTLQGLSEGTEHLQNPFNDQDIQNMFAQEGEQNAFVPFMQSMMQSLLSKEVLYPSLKDILEKYPSWLEANGAALSSEDRTRYEKQQDLMKEVCTELEKESDADSDDQKKARFDAVLHLMQKLQDYGQPPQELVGDVGPGLQFDPQGNPDLNQCSMM